MRGSESRNDEPMPSTVSALIEDLARLRRRADPRRNVHSLAAVVGRLGLGPERTARVCADSDVGSDDLVGERALDPYGRVDRGLWILERREEAVAGLLDDLAAGVRDALAHELVVAREQALPLVVTERLQQLRRVDDVREEERATRFDAAQELLDARLLDGRAEPLEGGQRRLELDRTRVLVSAPHVGDAESARARAVSYGAPTPCHSSAPAAETRSRRPVAFCDADLATREVHGRVERGSASTTDLVRVDDCVALVGRRARRLEIACCDRDLDLRRKSAKPEKRLQGVLERALDSRHGRVDLALGEPEEREAGLRSRPISLEMR